MKKEIIIIGGGIVGSTAAYYLSKESNHQIILIDMGKGTATRAAAGIICPWLSQRRNQDWYRLTAQGAAFYLQLMDDLTEAGAQKLPYQQKGSLVFKKNKELLEKLYQLGQNRRESAEMIGELSIYDAKALNQLIPNLVTDHGAVLTKGGGRLDGAALLDLLQKGFLQNGGTILDGRAQLGPNQTVLVGDKTMAYDHIILACGAWLPDILQPLGYQVDVRPQKGQLLELETAFETENWPGCILPGEIDILPFEDGKLVIGASHENDKGFDLEADPQLLEEMKRAASQFLPDLADLPISKKRVGTRAYTSNFLPFYGNLRDQPFIWVASGLGSSGLTSGPYIGWQMAREILGLNNPFDRTPFSPDQYIKIMTTRQMI